MRTSKEALGKSARLVFLSTLIAFATVGCRYRDPSIDLLHGELRWMEDQLYMLESELEATCIELSRCQQSQACGCCSDEIVQPARRHKPRLIPQKPRLIDSPSEDSACEDIPPVPDIVLPPNDAVEVAPAEPIYESNEVMQSPASDSTSILDDDPADMAPLLNRVNSPGELPEPTPATGPPEPYQATPAGEEPRLELPAGNDDSTNGTDSTGDPPLDREASTGNGIRLQSHHSGVSSHTVDAHITNIAIHCSTFEPAGEHHDLEVLIEPRNANGDFVSLPGRVAVVVVDRALRGSAARIGRWDLTAEETAGMLTRPAEGDQGIRLKLDWPDVPPYSSELYAFVRYYTVDGRRMESSQQLPPEQPAPRGSDNGGWVIEGQEDHSGGWKVVPDNVPDEPATLPDHQVAPASFQTQVFPPMDARPIGSGIVQPAPIPPEDSTSEPAEPGLLPQSVLERVAEAPQIPTIKPQKPVRPQWRPYR